MHRAQLTGNKICNTRFQERCHELHRKKLNSIKACVDNKPPPKYVHLIQNLKKQQMDEERYSAIERENYLLLDKMSYIMTHPQSFSGKRNKEPRSLNKEARKRELTKITEENRNILKRIQHKEPYYNHLDWEYERKIQEGYLKNICEYPYVLSDAMDARALQMQRSELSRSNQPNLAEYLDSKYGVGQPMDALDQAADDDNLGPPAPPTRITKKHQPTANDYPSTSSKKAPSHSDDRERELEQTVDEMLADQWRSSRPASAEAGADVAADAAPAPAAEAEAAVATEAAEGAPEGDAAEEPAAEEPAAAEPPAE